MIFSVNMAKKVQKSNCFSRIFDQNSFLFGDHPKNIYKLQTTSSKIMTSDNSSLSFGRTQTFLFEWNP